MPSPPAKSTTWGITSRSSVRQLAESPILDTLSGAELVVYLRLLAAVAKQRSRRVQVFNLQLHQNREGKTAQAALRSLEEMGVIKVIHHGSGSRQIEVK